MIKVGSVCTCQRGIVGIVTRCLKKHNRVIRYEGFTLDGGNWTSIEPELMYDSVREYIDAIVKEQEDQITENFLW